MGEEVRRTVPEWLLDAGVEFTVNSRDIEVQMGTRPRPRLETNERMKNKRLTLDDNGDDETGEL